MYPRYKRGKYFDIYTEFSSNCTLHHVIEHGISSCAYISYVDFPTEKSVSQFVISWLGQWIRVLVIIVLILYFSRCESIRYFLVYYCIIMHWYFSYGCKCVCVGMCVLVESAILAKNLRHILILIMNTKICLANC